MSGLTELQQALKAARIPLPLDNSGSNPGDLWGGDGRFIGNIDEPLFAAVIVAAVNAAPELERLARASQRRVAAVRAFEARHADPDGSQGDLTGIGEEMDAADGEIRATLAALGVKAHGGTE